MHVLSVHRPAKDVKQNYAFSTVFSQQAETLPSFAKLKVPDSTPRRRRIWNLNPSFHCSIIGTCLSTSDVRQVLDRLNLTGAKSLSEHEIHKYGVTLAGQSDGSAKLLQKALDRRHEQSIKRFDRANTPLEVERLWAEAVKDGDIPGAYWAVLTHPSSNDALQKKAFGEVHMLSHLVGAANRADIRRLRDLEVENATLREKIERQQMQIREAVVSRDAKINELSAALSDALAHGRDNEIREPKAVAGETMLQLIARLEAQLAGETARRATIEKRLQAVQDREAEAKARQRSAERLAQALTMELEHTEAALRHEKPQQDAADSRLAGQTVLYVGGMTGHATELQDIAQRFSAKLLHHDGGIENQVSQLPGLISQSAMVFFPVDCISHSAMQLVKRLSRLAGIPYVPMRSSGLTSFVAALHQASSPPLIPRNCDLSGL